MRDEGESVVSGEIGDRKDEIGEKAVFGKKSCNLPTNHDSSTDY